LPLALNKKPLASNKLSSALNKLPLAFNKLDLTLNKLLLSLNKLPLALASGKDFQNAFGFSRIKVLDKFLIALAKAARNLSF
jgi:hypothetical protein